MAGPVDDVMVVSLGGSSFALPVASVREIVRLPPVTRVPGLPAWVAGLTNVRGRVLAVLDLRPLLRLEAPRGDRLVILDGVGEHAQAGGRGVAGIIVDSAVDLARLPEGGLEPLPPGLPPEAAPVLEGITVLDEQPLALLSPQGLLGLRHRLAA